MRNIIRVTNNFFSEYNKLGNIMRSCFNSDPILQKK